jgi:hypothetical protein
LGRYRPNAGVLLVGLGRVEAFELGQAADLLGADERGLDAEPLGDREVEALVASGGLAEDADAAEAVLACECLDAEEGLFDGRGAVGDDVLDGDLVMAGVEAAEEVEVVLGDVGGEQKDGAGLVRGDGGVDLHGGASAADREGCSDLKGLPSERPRVSG